jgi:Zn-dependent protease with chaperone function
MNESRATRYQRSRRRARGAVVACGLALLAAAALTPAGRSLADGVQRATSALAPPVRGLAASLLFVSVLVAVWEVAVVAAALVLRMQSGRGTSRQAEERGAGAGEFLAAVLVLPTALWCALAVQTGASLAGTRWWVVTAALLITTLAVAMQAAPAFLARLGGTRPLNRPALIERLGALARRLRVDIESIDEVSSSASITSTALVAGTGRSRRVFIASDVLRDWSDEEIAVVVAHEFGHHAHHDLLWTLAVDAALVTGGLALSAVVIRSAGLMPGELAALPVAGCVTWGALIAATPLRHALSRWQERRADAFALELTGGAAGFRNALRRLAARHLAEERPSRVTRWLYHRHPTVHERLRLADRFEGINQPTDR